MSAYVKPPEGSACVWRDGPPPSVGWWPASRWEDPRALRWWDGAGWSRFANATCDAVEAGRCGSVDALSGSKIQWTDRGWPQ